MHAGVNAVPGGIPRRILVVKLADIGDAVLTTPAIRAIRETFPAARIDGLVAPAGAQVLELCPDLDQVISFPKSLFDRPSGLLRPRNAATLLQLAVRLRLGRYDTVLLLHHLTTTFGTRKFAWLCRVTGAPVRAGLDNGRGHFLTHRALDYGFGVRSELEYGLDVAATLGAVPSHTAPTITIPPEAGTAVERLLHRHGMNDRFVAIHPNVGAFSPARSWPVERFAAVASQLRTDLNIDVVLVGGRDASPEARFIAGKSGATDLTGQTTIAELSALLSRASLVVGSDSGIGHLASAVKTPLVTIFGPSNLAAWKPFGAVRHVAGAPGLPDSTAIAVTANVPCSPCFYTGFSLGRPEGCGNRICLSGVTAGETVRLARHVLAIANGASGEHTERQA